MLGVEPDSRLKPSRLETIGLWRAESPPTSSVWRAEISPERVGRPVGSARGGMKGECPESGFGAGRAGARKTDGETGLLRNPWRGARGHGRSVEEGLQGAGHEIPPG